MQRLQTLQTGQPFPLQVCAAIPVETDAHRIEKQVHAFMEAERRRGEWFDVPMDTATLEALIVRAVAYLAAQEAAQGHGEMEPRDSTIREIVGERVRRQRMALGLNQTALAEQTAIPIQVLSRLEHGHQSIYVERLVALAQALRVSTDYLLGLTQRLESPQETDVTPRPPKRPRPRKTTSVA
jgi:ribosome-binding protein aMBF1 (putative translation factor)